MESYIVIYFFIVLIFLRGIFKDLKLLIYIILSLGIVYYYVSYNKSDTSDNLVNNSTNKKNYIYNYGNNIINKKPIHKKNIRKLDYIKEELNNLGLENQTKLEIYSNLKKFIEIYNNFEIYDYKKNYLDDLVTQKTKIYNMVSSLNVTYCDKDEEVRDLFVLIENFLESYTSNFKNGNTYNVLDHPIGYEKNNYDLFN